MPRGRKKNPIGHSTNGAKPDFDYTFKLFYAQYVALYHRGWKIPPIHLEIIEYLEDEDWGDYRKKVLLLWRGVGKSTIVDLWVAYKLSKDPTLRFLFLSHDKAQASKSSRNIKAIIKRHPWCAHLVDNDLMSRVDEFFVKGYEDDRNASVRAFGVKTSGTGGRSDYIIFDDVEHQNNSGTPSRRESLRFAISELENTLIPETGKVLFIGTYHDSDSIYDDQVGNYGARLKRVPIIENATGEYPYMKGDLVWPERFPQSEVERFQKKSKNEFLSQYMLIPKSIEETYFDTGRLASKQYHSEMELYESGNRWYANLKVDGEKRRILSSTCYWDPALATIRGDDSVIALVLTDDQGRTYIHKAKAIKTDRPGDAEQQCEKAALFAKQNNVSCVYIEDNGPGAFLVGMMLKELNHTGIGVQAHHVPHTSQKARRLIEAYEGPLYGGTLYIHKDVYDGPFLIQMADFKPKLVADQRNDFIDAVAGAILMEPTYIGSHIPGNEFSRKEWEGTSSGKVEWNFEFMQDFSLDDYDSFTLPD